MVGLGNPGGEFAGSRHNLGAEVVTELAERHRGRLKAERGLHARVCTVRIGPRTVLLAIPQPFWTGARASIHPADPDHPADPEERTGRPPVWPPG